MALNNTADMQKTFKLPMLPGNACGQELLRRNFRKTQLLSGNAERGQKQAGIPVDFSATFQSQLSNTQGSANNDTLSRDSMSATVNSASLERKVLRFYGYYKEAVQESNVERERVRKIVICYFLEDGTMSVSEPKVDNSGIAFQGSMVKRHQIPRPDGNGPITFDMLAVGVDIAFYGRTFFLTDADSFTREFFRTMGVELAPAQEVPTDAYNTVRNRPREPIKESMASTIADNGRKVKLSREEIAGTKSFLENDRKVLRCDVRWDDTTTLYGEVHYFTLYYFVADETIEVVEKSGVNTGRDPFPSFVRRQKMFKPHKSQGEMTFTSTTESKYEHYSERDIRIGAELVLFGRRMMIYDYDTYTRQYMREKYGIVEYSPIDVAEKPKAKPVHPTPAYNGFGDPDEPVLKSLDIKPPRKDNSKYFKFGNNVVKFALRLENNVAVDEIRKFVLTCFLATDEVSVFEPVQRNSGIVGGKFLQRQKVRNPETGKNFAAQDFFVGKHVVINKFPFVVTATDERSLSFMEQNSTTFPQSNINAVMHKVQAMLMSSRTGLAEAFHNADVDGNGRLDYRELMGMVNGLGLGLSEQELVTVLRFLDRNGDSMISYEELISRIMPEGAAVARDDRPWEVIHGEMVNAETEGMSVADKVAYQTEKVETTTAAYAARAFLDAYNARRQLFHSEFRHITDFTADSKIGEDEFRKVVTDKLRLPLTSAQLNALSKRFFPHGSRRILFEEFFRLINGISNLDHNMSTLRDRR